MAAPKENSLSLRHGIGMERNIFPRQRELSQNNSISVLQHLEDLKKRELAAKLHNRQLLQQFDEAQDTLRSMLTLAASMRNIRVHRHMKKHKMEYERYLEYERFPLRQQPLWEKRQAAQTKDNRSDEVVTAPADQMLTSQAYYNQDRLSNLTYTSPPWLSCLHPQLRCPVSAPSQPHQLQQLASLTGQNDKTRLSQNAPDQASLQSDHHWSWSTGNQSAPEAEWEKFHMEDTFVEKKELQAETGGESSSKTERCTSRSCSSHLSRELDDKPVRLSNTPKESSESSQVSSSRRKEKRASSRHSSDRKGSISQSSSKTSSVTITAKPSKMSIKSDNSISSEEDIKRSTRSRKKGGHATEIERKRRVPNDRNREEVEEAKGEKVQSKSSKGQRSTEESGSQEEEKPKSSRDNFTNVCRDFSSSSSSSSSEEVSAEADEAEEKNKTPPREGEKDCDGDVNVNSGEEVQEKVENEAALERQNSKDEEEKQQEEEMEEQESDEESDQVEQSERLTDAGETSPQGDKESEGPSDEGEGKDEERGESDQEGEASEEGEKEDGGQSDQAEESNSDDSIISPQIRSKELQSTQEEKVENGIEDEDEDEDDEDDYDDDDDEGSASEKSEESSDDDDIEQLLAPQQQMEEKLEEQEENETTKAFCKVQSFQVKEVDLEKKNDASGSDEYDDFYD